MKPPKRLNATLSLFPALAQTQRPLYGVVPKRKSCVPTPPCFQAGIRNENNIVCQRCPHFSACERGSEARPTLVEQAQKAPVSLLVVRADGDRSTSAAIAAAFDGATRCVKGAYKPLPDSEQALVYAALPEKFTLGDFVTAVRSVLAKRGELQAGNKTSTPEFVAACVAYFYGNPWFWVEE